MPIFTFEGFTAGSLVAMSAAQGAQGAAGSVPEWRLSNMNTATLDILRIEPAELVAPVGIWFEATDIAGFAVSENTTDRGYDPAAHDITYIWDFDDPGTFGSHLNLPAAWNNSGVDYGKKAYHVFDTPGTYVIRLWAIDREGTTGERMVSITVADPDEVYTGVRTICVSNQGDFTGAPAGARLLTSLAAAQDAYRALGGTGRLLLRRGETFRENYQITGQSNHRIGAFGDAAEPRPILHPPVRGAGESFNPGCFGFNNGNTVVDSVFYDLDLQGDWDGSKETGDGNTVAIFYITHNTVDWNVLVYRCRIDGFRDLQPNTADPVDYTSVFADCELGNWRSIGIITPGNNYRPNCRFAMVGTSLHAKENACWGGYGTTTSLANIYGAIRDGQTQNVLISACSFYTASTPGGALQPAMRMCAANSSAPSTAGYYFSANRLVAEGGDVVFGVSPENLGANGIPGNQIVDMALLVGDYDTTRWSVIDHAGTTVRNTIFLQPSMTKRQTPSLFIEMRDVAHINSNTGVAVDYYNNTFLNQTASTMTVLSNSVFTDVTNENNVNHQPSASVTTFAPIDLSTAIAGFAPRNRGRRQGPEKVSTPVSGIGQNDTFTVDYPTGTSAADFSVGGRHTVQVGNGFWFSHEGHCSLAFGVTEITVTNLSNVTMTGTAQLGLDQDTLTTDTSLGSPTSVLLPVPQSNSQALTDEGGLQAYTQFDSGQRTRPKGAV